MKIYKKLVKLVYKHDQIENYRIYLIVKKYLHKQSGIFSLDDLLDVLHKEYGYRSLGHVTGNQRLSFKNTIKNRLNSSLLFEKFPDDRFKIISERHIIDINRSSHINISNEDLKTKKKFHHITIGCVAQGGGLASYKSLSKICNCTPGHVRKSLRSLRGLNKIVRKYNFIVARSSQSLESIEQDRKTLFKIHHINTPEPIKYNGEWYLLLYAPNSYFAVKDDVDTQIYKTSCQPIAMTYIVKKSCWYQSIKKGISNNSTHTLLLFNEKLFDMEKYVDMYSKAWFNSIAA